MNENTIKVGVVGTGFIGKGFVMASQHQPDIEVVKVLTRRDIKTCGDFPELGLLTNSVNELIDQSDLILECSGDVIHGADVVARAFEASLAVVTMDAELHVTCGSYFSERGTFTEAEGDQPGCLAAVYEDAIQMGFMPVVLGNVKGFQNLNPSLEDMKFWANKQGLSLPMVTASTDGTKLQFEQALLANGFGAGIVGTGLTGDTTTDLEKGAIALAQKSKRLGFPISDYLIIVNSSVRVFLVAQHQEDQREILRYLKMGDGPYYLLTHNTNLCHLEIAKTIRRIVKTGKVLLDNSREPTVSVAAVAKKDLEAGALIANGIGSFDVRGTALMINDYQGHLPIGLMHNAQLKRNIEEGQILTMNDVDIPNSLALEAWKQTEQSVLGESNLLRSEL